MTSKTGATADATQSETWLLVVTSKKLKLWAWVAAIVVLAIHIFMGVVVNVGNTGASITVIDQLAFPVIGLIIAAVCLLFTRARVRVNSHGVEVRNLLNARMYPWSDVYGLSFPRKSKWARLELPDFEFVPMMAMQSADGADVVKAVQDFRDLEVKYMPED